MVRIAISGSHSLGKSTFVSDFLAQHPKYLHEEEPYRVLMHKHEILFGDHQTQNHINLQLDHCLSRTKSYEPAADVIFDRCPVDYIPYSDYTATLAHTDIDKTFVKSLYDRIRPALHHLDLIVFVPMQKDYVIELEDDGHRPAADLYRNWVDEAFKRLYRENLESVMPKKNAPKVIEISGTREARIALLTDALKI